MSSLLPNRSLLNTLGSLVGILSGIISIVTFFFSDSTVLFASFKERFPGLARSFSALVADVAVLAAGWSLGPWLSALLIVLLIVLLRLAAEFVFDLLTTGTSFGSIVLQGVLFVPLALFWISVFSSAVSGPGLLAFLAAYLLSIALADSLASYFG